MSRSSPIPVPVSSYSSSSFSQYEGIPPSAESPLLRSRRIRYHSNIVIPDKLSPPRFIKGYKIQHVIGIGAFGEVRLGTCLKTGVQYAIKIVDPGKFRDDSSVSLKKEIEILKMLEQHERVVKIVEILEDVEFTGTWCTTCACTQYVPSGPDGHCKNCGSHDGHHHSSHEETKLVTLIVQELAVGGELFNIVLHNGALSENIARYYFLQLLEGVQFCHSKGIYHRDLKPENLILDSNLNLKLVDFGLAEVVDADRGDCVIYGSVGSQPYTAPEVYYNKDIHESQGYKGEPADVWSCAVSLYIMLTGRPPFRRSLNKTYGPLLKKCSHFSSLLSGSYPSRVSAMAKDLLRKMFLLDPSERPTVEEILQHPWCSDKLPAREEILMQMREFAERAWIKQDKNWMADIMLEITPEPQKSEAPAENENEYKQLETAVSEFELFSLSS